MRPVASDRTFSVGATFIGSKNAVTQFRSKTDVTLTLALITTKTLESKVHMKSWNNTVS